MSTEKGPKHIYAEEHQLYYYYYNFEEHLVQKQEHFATSETRMTRWLRPAGSNMLEPAKMFIRARIIRHNARQSYNNNALGIHIEVDSRLPLLCLFHFFHYYVYFHFFCVCPVKNMLL